MTDSNFNITTITVDDNNKPPEYSTAITSSTTNNEEAPPSYEDVFAELRRAKTESKNSADYAVRACGILCGSILITIILILSTAIPIAMIVVGALYKDMCPIDPKIPIWLIVAGSVACFAALLRAASNCFILYKKRKDRNYQSNSKNFLTVIFEIFLFIWFICGNVWIYSIKEIVSTSIFSPFYCNEVVYYFAFWIITLSWIFLILACCCCCCILVIAGCGIGIASVFKSSS